MSAGCLPVLGNCKICFNVLKKHRDFIKSTYPKSWYTDRYIFMLPFIHAHLNIHYIQDTHAHPSAQGHPTRPSFSKLLTYPGIWPPPGSASPCAPSGPLAWPGGGPNGPPGPRAPRPWQGQGPGLRVSGHLTAPGPRIHLDPAHLQRSASSGPPP